MPPTQKSTSTRSAHNESDAIGIKDVYYLSDYAFQIQRNSVASSTYDQITAVCTYKDGKNARQAIQVPSTTKMSGYYVEANGTEATVYAIVEVADGDGRESSLDTDPFPQPIPTASTVTYNTEDYLLMVSGPVLTAWYSSHGASVLGASSDNSGKINVEVYNKKTGTTASSEWDIGNTIIYEGKPVARHCIILGYPKGELSINALPSKYGTSENINVAWTMLYGTPGGEYRLEEIMVGRFAIDLEDAGGDGPGSDWDDPGDWNEDWEEGDPTQTLHVEVIGALSGRHNDPIEDPSYSYIPSDKETVKGYGCGGDGGHGGGGGAGASTVVVHKFATNQADGKEIVALAKRHGYGSGGGKGGKGGDGCILVYY